LWLVGDTLLWEIDTEDAEAYNERGLAYTELGDYEQTIEDFEMYLKLAPNAPDRAEVEAWIEELKESKSQQ
jgi:regulator of sirC expression with transglutaminase-like and TPR domain